MRSRLPIFLIALLIVPTIVSGGAPLRDRLERAVQKPKKLRGPLAGRVPFKSGEKTWIHSSTRAHVFRMVDPAGKPDVAARIFDRRPSTRPKRYEALLAHLGKAAPDLVAGMEFVEEAVDVDGEIHSAQTAPFFANADGTDSAPTLDEFVNDAVSAGDTESILAVAEEFADLSRKMTRARAGHNDLSHANLLVTPDKRLRAIDWDGAFVPALAGMNALELGRENYRQPNRTLEHFGPEVDHFPGLVIYASLRAIAARPELWSKFSREDNLLLTADDFDNPENSAALAEMEKIDDPQIRALTRAIRAFAPLEPADVPSLDAMLAITPAELEARLPTARPATIRMVRATPAARLPRASTANPGLLLYEIDGSGSMDEPFNGTNESRRDVVARIVNRMLDDVLTANTRGFSLVNRFEVAIITYSGRTAVSALPGGRDVITLAELLDLGQIVDDTVDGEPVKRRSWWTPRANGNTPMRAGIQLADRIITPRLRPGKLVVRFGVSDGKFNEPQDDPDPLADHQALDRKITEAGATHLNTVVQLTGESGPARLFLDSPAGLNVVNRSMFEMASLVPPELALRFFENTGVVIPEGARLHGINADFDGFLNLFTVGTTAAAANF